jgi:hypothetical protein
MIGFLAATVLSGITLAQPPSDPLEVCAQKADAAARLACFDQEMQRRHATPQAPVAAVKSAPAPGTAPDHTDENAGLSGPQLRKKLREEGVVEPPKPKPIVAQVARAEWHPDHLYTLFLDNGQVWEQVEQQQGVYVDAHETVTITSGVLGAFFLETSKQKNFRVRRLR